MSKLKLHVNSAYVVRAFLSFSLSAFYRAMLRSYATVSPLSACLFVRLSVTLRYVFSHRLEYFESNFTGATEKAGMENAGLENVGPNCRGGKGRTGKHGTKMQGWKSQDWKMQDQICRGGKGRTGKHGTTTCMGSET